MTISPKFGIQIDNYYSTIHVVYSDSTNDNMNITIKVKPSYPYFKTEPAFLSNLTFGTSSTSQALPNRVYSFSPVNATMTFKVYEKSTQTEVTLPNPLTYSEIGNTITFNCFSSNGIEGGKIYYLSIKLSENAGFAVYGNYTFDVLYPSTPVFVD